MLQRCQCREEEKTNKQIKTRGTDVAWHEAYYYWPHPLSIWPHLFRGAGHVRRRGEQLKWSLAFRLYIGSFPCAQLPGRVHIARLGWVFFCAFSLGLCFVCSFVLFDMFACPHSFMFTWAVESSPLSVFGARVTNWNGPPRALAASTIAWVRS